MTYAELTFIRGDEINNFEIFDEQGNKVDFIATRKTTIISTFSAPSTFPEPLTSQSMTSI